MCINPSHDLVERDGAYVRYPFPCKQCWQCRQNRINDYTGRCLAEAAYSDWTVALTLTYRDQWDKSHEELHKEHFQDFIRAIRRRGYLVRYLVAGEYGERKGRAHFHCIIFGKGKRFELKHRQRDWWHEVWPFGHIFADWVIDQKAVQYVTKYIVPQKGQKEGWFSCSKKPALGMEYFLDKAKSYVSAGLWPKTFHYIPPGARSDHQFLVKGACRREMLLEIIKGYSVLGVLDVQIKRTTDTCAAAIDKICREFEKMNEMDTIEELFWDLEKKRPNKHYFEGLLQNIWSQMADANVVKNYAMIDVLHDWAAETFDTIQEYEQWQTLDDGEKSLKARLDRVSESLENCRSRSRFEKRRLESRAKRTELLELLNPHRQKLRSRALKNLRRSTLQHRQSGRREFLNQRPGKPLYGSVRKGAIWEITPTADPGPNEEKKERVEKWIGVGGRGVE